MTRKERARRTRQKILDTALELFLEEGFDGTSLDRIARATGVTKGAFYAHFASKSSIIYEYLDTLDLDYRTSYTAMPADRNAPSALMSFADTVVGILETRLTLNLLRIVYRAEAAGELPVDPFVSQNRELYRIFLEILEKGKREGEFRTDIDSAATSVHIVMALRGICFEWCSRGPAFNIHAELAVHMEILTKGLLNR